MIQGCILRCLGAAEETLGKVLVYVSDGIESRIDAPALEWFYRWRVVAVLGAKCAQYRMRLGHVGAIRPAQDRQLAKLKRSIVFHVVESLKRHTLILKIDLGVGQ